MLRRFLAAVLALLFFTAPSCAANLAKLTITTALSGQTTTVYQFRDGPPRNLAVQCNFTYGSGGTSADAWVQVSLDGGTTWADIANCHFATSSARFQYNLSSGTPVTTEYTPTDGTLSANTSKDGILGSMIRIKWTSVGTYASTTLTVDVQSASRVVQ